MVWCTGVERSACESVTSPERVEGEIGECSCVFQVNKLEIRTKRDSVG